MNRLMHVKNGTGANGHAYSAFVRSYGSRQHFAFVEGDGDPLYRGAVRSTRDAAEKEAERMHTVYMGLSA